jgi:AcrR family transcriptional regulator
VPAPDLPARTRDAEATKARLLRAATDEFAAHGIAGARVDRIGAAAKVNKALIYTYFGSKDQLFDAVMDAHVTRVLDEVPFTPQDLPGYAGALFDFLIANPHQLRLATWHRLERAGTGREPAELSASLHRNAEAIALAQAGHAVPADFSARDLLVFTLALASAWMPDSPVALPAVTRPRAAAHRAAVVEAVRRLTTPAA